MAGKDLRARGITVVIVAAAAAAVAGCGPAGGGARSGPRAPGGTPAAGGFPTLFVAAVSGGIRYAPHGLAVFSSADGQLLRWLVPSAPDPIPVSVSPDGRWLYYYDRGAPTGGRCPVSGFTDPVLWRVPTVGGRPRRAGVRTPSIAFSPDGRMVAWTASSGCGRLVWIVVRDTRTGATRRILLARNNLAGNNQVGSAQLSWAPDDAHLAVAVAPAAAINALSVINALRARTAIAARSIPSCPVPGYSGCLDPAFDVRGRLTFLKWREGTAATSFAEWVIRWQRGRAGPLFRLSGEQSGGGAGIASIAVDRTGDAVLLDGGTHYPQIWRWCRGQLNLILRSTPRRVVWNPLWLPASVDDEHVASVLEGRLTDHAVVDEKVATR